MTDLALLLQAANGGASAVGIFHFFLGFSLIITFYTGFFGFTYWISKDE